MAHYGYPGDPNFSLGEALFGSAPLQAPDAWRLSLLHCCMGPKERLIASQLSRGSRDWVCQGARAATLRLSLYGSTPKMAAKLSAARHALTVRGQHPTTVILKQSAADEAALLMAPDLLHGLPLTDLQLECLHLYDNHTCETVLMQLAAAFPALRSLNLQPLRGRLPPPSGLPHLSHLTFRMHPNAEDDAFIGVAALLPQLTFLEASTTNSIDGDDSIFWIKALGTTTHTLTHFSTHQGLDDLLLGLLMKHAPVLTHLTVDAIDLQHDAYASQRCALSKITLRHPVLEAASLTLLPASTGSLQVQLGTEDKEDKGQLILPVKDVTGLMDIVVERLPHWVFTGVGQLDLRLDSRLSLASQPAALAAGLQQLKDLQCAMAKPELWLVDWHWSSQTARVVEDVSTAGYPYRLCVDCSHLTPSIADALIQHAPSVTDLAAGRLQLPLDYQPPGPCRWKEVTLCDSMYSLQDLLTLLPLNAPVTLYMQSGAFLMLHMPRHKGHRKPVKQLTAGLPRLPIRSVDSEPFTVVLVCDSPCDDDEEVNLLQQHLKVLSAMDVQPGVAQVELDDWRLSDDVVSTLADLPPWSHTVSFDVDTWTSRPTRCRGLAAAVPQHYKTWCVKKMSQSQLEDMCGGLVERGPPAEAGYKLVLKLHDQHQEAWVRSYLHRVGDVGWVGVQAQAQA